MKQPYEFNRNPKQPDKQEIEGYKDFDALLETYEKTPRIRRRIPVGLSVAASAAILILGGWWAYQRLSLANQSYEAQAQAYFAKNPFVNPPLPVELQPDFAQYSLNAAAGGVIEHPSGSRILVPAAAFVDQSGRPVDGPVEIRFRELHDYVDFFLGGIPMAYDSAGVEYALESAGMVEIYAEQKGRRLDVKPGKALDVELVSQLQTDQPYDIPAYQVYQLDTAQRNWVYQSADQITVVETEVVLKDSTDNASLAVIDDYSLKMRDLTRREQEELDKTEASLAPPRPPVRPLRHNGTGFVFNFDVSALVAQGSLSPEEAQRLSPGTLWQVKPGQGVGEDQLNRNWDDVQLRALPNNEFELVLTNASEKIQVITQPVLSGEAFEQAISEYHQKQAVYETLAQEWEANLAQQRESIRQAFRLQKEELQRYLGNQLAESLPSDRRVVFRHRIINRFKATSCGIWNCDRPAPQPEVQARGQLVDEQNRPLRNTVAYLVDRTRNTVSRVYVGNQTELRYRANGENLLWMITEDRRIAIFRPSRFRSLNPDESVIQLELVDRDLQSEADVRAVLVF